MRAARYYLLIFLVSLLPLTSLFTSSDLPHTHDGLVHLPRIAAYFKALSDGQIPIRWAGDLNYGYGMPLFNFIYQLPYFISSVFLILGLGLVDAFKLTLSLSFILSGIFMFAFARAFFEDGKKALLATVFYQFAPFRLVEVLIRGSFGEVYTYTFLPLVLFGITMLWKKRGLEYFLLTVFATALLALSHNSVSLLFFVLSVGFVLVFARERGAYPVSLAALGCGLLLSSFYWVPAVLEHRYTYGDLLMKRLYLENFAPVQKFLLPNITNGESLQIGGVSVQLGLFHVAALIIAVVLMIRNRLAQETRKLFIFCICLIVLSFFFILPISKPFWEHISILRQFQFPWRFLSLVVFATSMLSVSFLMPQVLRRNSLFTALTLLVIASTIFYWRPTQYDKIDERYYWNFPLTTTYYGETDVIWSAGPRGSYPNKQIELIGGKAVISNFKKKSNLHTFTVEADTNATLVDHTQYYPGWRVYIDEKNMPIQFQDPNWRGEIEFAVPKGEHNVRVAFEETKVRLIVDFVSLTTFSLLVIGLAQRVFKRRRFE